MGRREEQTEIKKCENLLKRENEAQRAEKKKQETSKVPELRCCEPGEILAVGRRLLTKWEDKTEGAYANSNDYMDIDNTTSAAGKKTTKPACRKCPSRSPSMQPTGGGKAGTGVGKRTRQRR